MIIARGKGIHVSKGMAMKHCNEDLRRACKSKRSHAKRTSTLIILPCRKPSPSTSRRARPTTP
jgi:hypothetical protein